MRNLLLLCLVLLVAPSAGRGEEKPPVLREVDFDQRLGAHVPLDAVFRSEDGTSVRFGDCVGGKPTVLVLAWYRCPMLCTQVLNKLTQCLRALPFQIGHEFNVVTISFDPDETPELAAAKKASYVEDYGRPGAEAGWRFLTGERDAIMRITAAVGFHQRWDPATRQYAHPSGIVLLTPEGQVSRYFYGLDYPPGDVRLGLVEASANRIGSPVDKLLLFCYHYDPKIGRYTATVMNLVRLAGVLSVIGIGWLLLRGWLRRPAMPAPLCEGRLNNRPLSRPSQRGADVPSPGIDPTSAT
jgi:protein SCO1/2